MPLQNYRLHITGTAHSRTPCNHPVHVELDALLQAKLAVQLCSLDMKTACGTEHNNVYGDAETHHSDTMQPSCACEPHLCSLHIMTACGTKTTASV